MPLGFGIGIVSTDQIADGAVTNAKVNAAAAIAGTKLEAGWQKNNASGIAGLDANSRVAAANSFLMSMSAPARAIGTAYTNGARPRLVIVSVTNMVNATANSRAMVACETPTGTAVVYTGIDSNLPANANLNTTSVFLVAPGATYQISSLVTGTGGNVLAAWNEIDF